MTRCEYVTIIYDFCSTFSVLVAYILLPLIELKLFVVIKMKVDIVMIGSKMQVRFIYFRRRFYKYPTYIYK